MRLGRRAFLVAVGAGSFAAVSVRSSARARPRAPSEPQPIDISATRIDSFSVGDKERRDFGALRFRSGLQLRSEPDLFGGWSSLWRAPGGEDLVAVSDTAVWLTAKLVSSEGRLTGLRDAVVAPVLGRDGRPLGRSRSYDTESMTIAGGTAYIGIERTHEVMRFNWGKDRVRARAQPVPVPSEAKHLPLNQSFEAIGVAPPTSPLSGAVVVIAERAREGTDAPTRGFILTGPRQGAFDVMRSDGYDLTDLAFLPSGEMLVLERRVSLLRGFGARIRRMAADAISPGATVDGPVIFEAGSGEQIDNMEGLSVHRDTTGETIVSMISDDNFSSWQRTVLLEFSLAE